MFNKRADGGMAEKAAAEFLERGGYRILKLNYTAPFGEIDIIAVDGGCTVFVEVKSRRSDSHGRPEEAVDVKKQRHMIKTALAYLKSRNMTGTDVRFDVVAVGPGPSQVEHIKSAFFAEPGYTC